MTGSTTVDSNFLLAHKEQLDEVFQVYLDDINPFIVQFEILKNEFPIELQNEIRAMYGHLARAAGLENTVVICISMDLPFAQSRFCSTEGLDNVTPVTSFCGEMHSDSFPDIIR